MSKKKWGLLLLAALLIFGYIKLFYKTYSEKTVAKNADCIVSIDVKRVTNTLIWNFITTPSQWKEISLSSKKTKEISWKDMVEIPDYIFLFHCSKQPANIWYSLFTINDSAKFEKGMIQFGFEKNGDNTYFHKVFGLYAVKKDDKVLLAIASEQNKNFVDEIATELFTKKSFIAKAELSRAISTASHASVYLPPNFLSQKETIVSVNFDKHQIQIKASLFPEKNINFIETKFSYSPKALLSMGFTQPGEGFYQLLNNTFKEKVSTAVNFNIDSLLLPGNKQYLLTINDFKNRVDTAITYTYDDEFNKVEVKSINQVQEPSLDFKVDGKNPGAFYDYLLNSGKLEVTDTGALFLPMPFVKTYCIKKNTNQLLFTSFNYTSSPVKDSVNAVFFLKLHISNIPQNLQNYFPDVIKKSISNLDELQIEADNYAGQLEIKCVINKKKNDLPLFKF